MIYEKIWKLNKKKCWTVAVTDAYALCAKQSNVAIYAFGFVQNIVHIYFDEVIYENVVTSKYVK